MKRFRDDRPADICFARGTFNAHPYVMGAMNEFLLHLDSPEMKQIYRDLDQTWDRRAADLNRRLAERQLPVRIGHLSSIWTVCYPTAARYHWWEPGALATDRAIKRRILREMASHLFGFPGRGRKERLAGPQPLDAAL
jgi:glutamate-1-semialdehyde aminotransferase